MPSFKIRNTNSNLVIDHNYANLGLRTKGVVAATAVFTYNSKFVDLVLPNDQGVIAFRCTSPCMIVSSQQSGGNMVYRFVVSGGGANIEYWHFDLVKYSTLYNTPARLIIRRPSDGQVAFDSRTPYMRVRQFLSWNQIPGSTDLSYAGTPAVVQVKRGWSINRAITGIPPGQTQFIVWVSSWATTNGGTVNVRGLDYMNINDTNPNAVYPDNNFSEQTMYMVIDVSNF